MSTQEPAREITVHGRRGTTITLYEPIGPGLCGRCRDVPEDLCFAVGAPGQGVRHGALCAGCLVEVLGHSMRPNGCA